METAKIYLKTKPFNSHILKAIATAAEGIESSKPFYPPANFKIHELPEETRSDLATILHEELERRFVALCEAIDNDGENIYPDTITITEALARYKEVFYILDLLKLPYHFHYNTVQDYCRHFRITEGELAKVILDNQQYVTDRTIPEYDTDPLPEILRVLTGEFLNDLDGSDPAEKQRTNPASVPF